MSIDNPVRLFVHFAKTLSLWIYRSCERRALRDLDDHLLRDLGMTRERARLEGERPFWSGAERDWLQPRFTAFSEKESGSRGSSSGSRNSRGSVAGTIFGNSR